MGRTEKSQGLAPPAVRKDLRAKHGKHIINKFMPALLASNARARRGADSSELIANPEPVTIAEKEGKSKDVEAGGEDTGYVKRKGQGRRKVKDTERGEDGEGGKKSKGKSRKKNDSISEDLSNLTLKPTAPPKKKRSIRIITTDTLTAAHMLANPSLYDSSATSSKPSNKKSSDVCILNMASPLRPGGGVLTGATSQEETLCTRTTLLPSLKESFYRLPEFGAIYTPDVLVFRSSGGELPASERWFVDVISAGMLRFPELEGGEDEAKRLTRKDREAVEGKVRAVLRIAEKKGVKNLVLGAWGCGAYGNPVIDIAQAFKRVLSGSPGKKSKKEESETWPNLEEVVFAISNRKLATNFAAEFGGMEVEAGPGAGEEDEDEDEEDKVAEELRTKIQEMESQLSKVWNPDLKARMGSILNGLKAQLKEREGTPEASTLSGDEEESSEGELGESGRDDREDGV
jgi:uncharacterized protein (TIGR02452 family)